MGISGRSSKKFCFVDAHVESCFLVLTTNNQPTNQPNQPTPISIMPSDTEQLTAKLAEIAKSRKEKQKEEMRRRMEEEAEAEASRLEEERLQLELERMRVAEEEQRKREAAAAKAEQERKELEEFKRRENEANEARRARKEDAKAGKKAGSGKKAESGKKRGRDESVEVTVGSVVAEDGVKWSVRDGQVCVGCAKSGDECLWRDSPRATACRSCHAIKKTCEVGAEKDWPEAGSSKKRKVAAKGKGKEKEKSESESGLGADAGAALLGEIRGLREEIGGVREEIGGLRAEFRTLGSVGRTIVRLLKTSNESVDYIADRMDELTGNNSESGDEEAKGVDGVDGVDGDVGVEGNVGGEGMEVEMEETLQ